MDKNLLLEAEAEIRELRRQNEILGAKVEVMNLFATVLHTQPAGYGPMGASECVASKLRREHDRLAMEEKTVKPGGVPADPNRPSGPFSGD